MDNQFRETKNISYFQNVKSSIFGVIIGIVLFIASFILLWWNEGNSVRLIQKEDFINKNAIVVSSDGINRANDYKLIATSGQAKTQETLFDSLVSIDNALKLKRQVEMYQWVEQKRTSSVKNSDGSTTETTTYTYEKKWDSSEHNSDNFKKQEYHNPKFTIESTDMCANTGTLGSYIISDTQTSQIKKLQEVHNLKANSDYKTYDNYYYRGKDPNEPNIGDLKISYQYAPSGTNMSIVAQQNPNNTFSQMPTKSGMVYLQYDGIYSLDEMVHKYAQGNTLLTFGIRLGGFLMMFIGLSLLVGPIIAIARFIPFLSEVLDFITKSAIFCIALILSMLTIAIAWFAYRPLLSIALLILVGVTAYYLKQNISNKQKVV